MKLLFLGIIVLSMIAVGCTNMRVPENQIITEDKMNSKLDMADEDQIIATFGGGCFWCMEASFEPMTGVTKVISGYTGGEEKDAKYSLVGTGNTGHVEAVQVYYDPMKITYKQLLDHFWRQIDPTDEGGQFADRGSQYKTAIFYHSDEQKRLAQQSKKELEDSKRFDEPIATEIIKLQKFFEAEEYHQDYYKKAPLRYSAYASGSGRKGYIEEVWTKPDKEILKKRLTELQYKVTQEDSTERAFENEYWDNTDEGIYVDIISGEPLFSSKDKFKSGTGWPSFSKSLVDDNIIEKEDNSIIGKRTEVRSKYADSHLGHLFDDGPTGPRYCINSASLKFIPKGDLEKEGYGNFQVLFEENSSS